MEGKIKLIVENNEGEGNYLALTVQDLINKGLNIEDSINYEIQSNGSVVISGQIPTIPFSNQKPRLINP